MKRIIVCALAVLSVITVLGQSRTDSVKVYFHIGQWQFDPALGDNAASMNAFIEKVRVASETHNLDRIVIRSYVSPDGTDRFNQRLAVERCNAIAGLIADRVGINRDVIDVMPKGVSWIELRRLVAETPDVPSREKILDIIDNTPIYVFDSNGRIIDGRKKQLMDLRGGRPYNWMFEHIFPQLRNAVAVSLCLKAVYPPPQIEPEIIADTIRVDTIGIDRRPETISADVVESLDSVAIGGPSNTAATDTRGEAAVNPYTPRHRMALKTNLPYYAILMPNLELEYLITDRWSVALEGNVAWWGDYSRNKSYRIAIISPEVRRWIKPREPWHGIYVGAFAGGGWYDLQNGGLGYYGDGVMAGLSVGYMWPIGKRLSLDAGLGAGYMHTRFKEYVPYEGHHLYQRDKSMNYFGPLKVKFSLGWRLWDENKSQRRHEE